MFRKPTFWISFILVSLACGVFAYHYFPQAFPVVTVDLRMDRTTALKRAAELAERFGWGPEAYQQAASYQLDRRVQSYVELEAGGVDAFREMIAGDLYSPFTWNVRHFREYEVNETLIRFTPEGEPYGFVEKLSEDQPGPVISSDSARIIAEGAVIEFWEIDLNAYELVETSKELQPGGRLDHTFVYQRKDEKIGEAQYRLRLVVSGSRLTELTHFVRVPEAFDRRYEEMRSANNTLATSSFIAASILFFGGGCIIGLFFLLRQRWVIWKTPLLVGLVVSFLGVLARLNAWPLYWMDYDTALSSGTFVLQQIVSLVTGFVVNAILFTLTYMAAETLTRKAFPQRPQFWKVWSKEVAATPYLLGITAAAFLFVSIDIAYLTGIYSLTTSVLGWWSPSSALFDPDVIAQYFPWFTALVIPLNAAFWEECLFRAVPIAGAVLLGNRFGARTYWIIGAFVLQALIFGAIHASYPQQPFYARAVELIIPSIIFGLLYFYFGLLPAILLHFGYNLVWFSLPIFVANVPGIWVDQILIVLFGLIPFWVILIQRMRRGRFADVPEDFHNRSWQPPTPKPEVPAGEEVSPERPALSLNVRRVMIGLGVVGLILWLLLEDFDSDAPPIEITRSTAVSLAEEELRRRKIDLPENWRPLSRVSASIDTSDRFIWQKGGEDVYASLMGKYLTPPHWYVRFVTFEGDVAERAEEYRVYITGRDNIYRFTHILPEARPGKRLDENSARRISDSTVREGYGMNPDELKFISAVSSSLPERTDWTFTYADTISYPLQEGESRIDIKIAGDRVVDTRRYIHIPEEWSRDYREKQTVGMAIEMSSAILVILLYIAGIVTAIVRWARGKFNIRAFIVVFILFACLIVIEFFNNWQTLLSDFSTAEPFINQLISHGGFALVELLFIGGVMGLYAGLIHGWNLPRRKALGNGYAMVALFSVFFILGISQVISVITPSLKPVWGNYDPAGASIPVLAAALSPFRSFLMVTLFLLFLVVAVDRLTNGWRRRRVLFGILLFLLGLVFAGTSEVENVSSWLIGGATTGLLILLFYTYILRFHLPLLILVTALYVLFNGFASAAAGVFPGAVTGLILSSVVILTGAWWWYGKIGMEAH